MNITEVMEIAYQFQLGKIASGELQDAIEKFGSEQYHDGYNDGVEWATG
jgi:hypothetical protein